MAQSESFGFCTEAVKTKLSELSTEGGTFKTSQTTKTVCQEKIKRERVRSKCAAALPSARFSVFALLITCVKLLLAVRSLTSSRTGHFTVDEEER